MYNVSPDSSYAVTTPTLQHGPESLQDRRVRVCSKQSPATHNEAFRLSQAHLHAGIQLSASSVAHRVSFALCLSIVSNLCLVNKL